MTLTGLPKCDQRHEQAQHKKAIIRPDSSNKQLERNDDDDDFELTDLIGFSQLQTVATLFDAPQSACQFPAPQEADIGGGLKEFNQLAFRQELAT